jgi:hypothetical protein
MIESTQDSSAAYATALLVHYCFDLGGCKAEELVRSWLQNYKASWVRLAAIEALYQGRYKAVSVEQILATWNRRGRPIYRFNHEFERLIGRKFPYNITAPSEVTSEALSNTPSLPQVFSRRSLPEDPDNIDSASTTSAEQEAALVEVTDVSLDATETPSNFDENVSLPEQQEDVSSEPNPVADASIEETNEPLSHSADKDKLYQADWFRWEVRKRPINQFTPSKDASDFYLKLKAVVQHTDDENEDAIAEPAPTIPPQGNPASELTQ